MGRSRKPEYVQAYRGFESHPLRQSHLRIKGLDAKVCHSHSSYHQWQRSRPACADHGYIERFRTTIRLSEHRADWIYFADYEGRGLTALKIKAELELSLFMQMLAKIAHSPMLSAFMV
jgi:hypothetical protein